MKRMKLKKLNNDGAALIIAIVSVTFITILVTLLLYVTVMNYEMKTTDYRTTVSFYGAETPLEEIRAQLAVDASVAAEEAYRHVIINYGILADEDMRATEFQKKFFESIEATWQTRNTATNSWVTGIKTILTDETVYQVIQGGTPDSSVPYHIYLGVGDPVTGDGATKLERDETNGRIILRAITVEYTENGFVSQISTDFCITVPLIDWSVSSSSDPGSMTAEEAANDGGYRVETVGGELVKYSKNVNLEECVSYLNWTKQ